MSISYIKCELSGFYGPAQQRSVQYIGQEIVLR
jgi:hypothetical protein